MRSGVGAICPLSFFFRDDVFLVLECDFDEVDVFDEVEAFDDVELLEADVCVCAESACANTVVAKTTASNDIRRSATLMTSVSPDEVGKPEVRRLTCRASGSTFRAQSRP